MGLGTGLGHPPGGLGSYGVRIVGAAPGEIPHRDSPVPSAPLLPSSSTPNRPAAGARAPRGCQQRGCGVLGGGSTKAALSSSLLLVSRLWEPAAERGAGTKGLISQAHPQPAPPPLPFPPLPSLPPASRLPVTVAAELGGTANKQTPSADSPGTGPEHSWDRPSSGGQRGCGPPRSWGASRGRPTAPCGYGMPPIPVCCAPLAPAARLRVPRRPPGFPQQEKQTAGWRRGDKGRAVGLREQSPPG